MWSGHEEGGSKDRVIKRKRRWSDTLQNRSIDGDNFFISKQRLLFWSLWWREVMKRRQKETKEDRGRECSPSATLFKIKIKTTATFFKPRLLFWSMWQSVGSQFVWTGFTGSELHHLSGLLFCYLFLEPHPSLPLIPPAGGGWGDQTVRSAPTPH